MTNWRYKIGINLMKIIVADIMCKVNYFCSYQILQFDVDI